MRRLSFPAALLCALLLLTACAPDSRTAELTLDGKAPEAVTLQPDSDDPLRLRVTWDGETLLDLPFGQAHEISVQTPGGGENRIRMTGQSAFMESANCENQDCVHMGEVNYDNWEMRVMGGFIVCLPHKVSVEVYGD